MKGRIGSMSMVFLIPVILLMASSVFNIFSWSHRYDKGFGDGRSAGYSDGYKEGEQFGFQNGNSTGYASGYKMGGDQGRLVGYEAGFEAGKSVGLDSGYKRGKDEGYSIGFVTGNETGFNLGLLEGYSDGYMQGVKDGARRGWTIRDPTYSETIQFIFWDTTDSNTYDQDSYNCFHFTADVKSNSYEAGYRCFLVYLVLNEGAHAIVSFNTTDKGLIFIEPQDDRVITPRVGQPYWDRSRYLPPSYDDTIVSITLVP